ncbi:synaptotagmin-like protein 2 isoform X3 [Hemicordylus capensis]|uniref:synaptotagmin-like protein 2 isoform X3 n=1 Tax=Hemicordylus capensis TaxID=884348 RepID=UPI0023047F87|nr:synaptotagmin-like protein 2 isoform X3 [Hemicordylus capensis]
MIDLSFLTEEEQEAILKVLQRDAELKRAEEERLRHLPEKVKDDSQIKNMSGQWFYDAKSKRHRDKIHGADIIRASMRRKPLTTAELNRSKSDKTKNSWVNNVNKKEVFMPPELFGAIEETERESNSSESPKVFSAVSNVLDKPQEDTSKSTVSPSKRKNPFNDSALSEYNSKSEPPKNGTTDLSEASKKDTLSPSVENQSKVTVTNDNRVEETEQASVEANDLQRQAGKPPVPKARRNIHKTSDVSLESEDSFPRTARRNRQVNGQGTPPRGILKRSSSSSSTDSEVLRLNHTLDPPNKSGLPTLTILEGVAEKSPPAGESGGFSQNSLERLKQVRFSSSVSRKERPQSCELHEGKETGEFSLLDSQDQYAKTSENQWGALDAAQSKETLPVKPPCSRSPVLNGDAEDRRVSHEGDAASSSCDVNRSGTPSIPLKSEQSPPMEPKRPNESPSKIFPKASEEQTVDDRQPSKTKQMSPEPDISKSTTGQQLPLTKTEDPQVPSVSSSDLERGKPALVEGQTAKSTSKSDRHATEVLKAADESISKVLDWFKRSSSTEDDKENPSLIPQGRDPTQETEVPQMREDNTSSTEELNLDSLRKRELLINNAHQFQESVNQAGQLSLAKNRSPSDLLLEEQRNISRRAEETVNLSSRGQCINGRERTHFQTPDQGTSKEDGTLIWGDVESKQGENVSGRELRAFEDRKIKLGLKRADSSIKVTEGENNPQAHVDGRRGVESCLEEGNFEHQAQMPLKELGFLDEITMQPDTKTNQRNLPLLQQHEFNQPSLMGNQKRVKDIRAFWEREKIPPNKKDALNESRSVSVIQKGNGELKPMGGSSGYVTGESDNEQSKYNVVTFRKVELNDDDSEPKDNDNKFTFRKVELSDGDAEPKDDEDKLGKTGPTLMDKFKENRFVDRPGNISPSNWKDTEFTEVQDADKLHQRHSAAFSSKKDGDLPAVAGKEKTSLPQKLNFKVHSLKERTDEESRAQRLDPSQFQSLRSFWDVGTRPQNKADDAKADRVIPDSKSSTGSPWKESTELKAVRVGTSQGPVWEDKQQNLILKGEKVKEPGANISPGNLLEVSRVTPTYIGGQPVLTQSTNSVPTESPEFGLTKDNHLERSVISRPEEETALPVKECIEKTVAPSKVQGDQINRGLQKLLIEASRESLPLKAQLAIEEQTCSTNQTPSDLPANEVADTVNRALIQPKTDTNTFNSSVDRLLKEAFYVTSSPSHCKEMDFSEQEASPLEKRRFFNKVMERSNDVYPSGDDKSGVISQTEETRPKKVLSKDELIVSKPGLGNLPREMEKSNPVAGEDSSRGEVQRYLDDGSSQKEIFQTLSPKLILPDAHFAVQKGTESPGKEITETVTETSVPSKRECRDLNAKLVILLKEYSKMPCISPTTESTLKKTFDNLPEEDQQRSYRQVNRNTSQMTSLPRETISETTERNIDTNKNSDNIFNTIEGGTSGEATLVLPSEHQKNLSAQSNEQLKGNIAYIGEHGGQQPKEVEEKVMKTVKPDSLEHGTFKTSLSKLLKENTDILLKDVEAPKSAHALLQLSQSKSSVYHKDAPYPQEIKETVGKALVPSRSRDDELKTNLLKLLKEDSEILPSNQKSADDRNKTQIERKSNQTVNLVCPQEMQCSQEVKETVNKTVALSKPNQNEFSSGLQKLLEEASQTPPTQLECFDAKMKVEMQSSQGIETVIGLPYEADETVVKSIAPARDDTKFNSSFKKLVKESSSLQLSKDDSQEVSNDSADLLAKRSPSVSMPATAGSMPSGYRTEVKIPLKGKTFKQESDQTAEESEISVPEKNVAFQKKLLVNRASSEAPFLEKEEGYLMLARTDERESEYKSEKKVREVSTASVSLDKDEEKPDLVFGSQKSSTPLAAEENAPKMSSKVELLLATHHGGDDDDDDDGDARSFGSDLSNENLESFVGFQRSSTRSEGELNLVLEALQRSSNRQIPSKSLEDIPAATSNQGKVNIPKEDLMLSAEDVSTAPSFTDHQFSNPEKIKRMSKSVPAFLQEESDRDTDTASDSSYPLGRIKKSPSSLTNLSGSSGLASLSSVSTSVMSVYSGDFGNVDVTGNIQFAIDYVEQLKELHIFIAQCKELAIADVKKQRSDPYVKSYLLPEKYKLGKRKTSVKKKTLNPVFNEILRYKVDKALLASQRLNLSVWHNDTFGRNSFLGEVELNLGTWDWNDKQSKQMNWYLLKPRTPLAALELENRGEIKLALQYIPQPAGGKKTATTGEVHIWVKECNDLPILRGNKLNSFVKCTVLPDTSRKSRQKTRAVAKTTNPVFNHTMVYDGFRAEDLKEACVELTVWDHNKLANHFLGGLRIGLGTGKSYGTEVDWMDSTLDEANLWERMINSPNKWVEDTLPLRMLMIAKMTK